MKTVSRILLVLAIVCGIYFATVGRNAFFRVIDTIYDVIQVFAANYTRK
jgi:type IV secretory pathway VirB2 component (pilin)